MPGGISRRLQHLAGLRIDAPQVALVAFPGAVPQLAVDPGDAGDEAVGLDGAQDRSRSRDRSDGSCARGTAPTQSVPSAQARPESPPPPGAGIVASTRPVFGIDLLDAVLGDLEQVLAVERGAGVRRRRRACAAVLPLSGSNAFSRSPDANQTCLPSKVTPATCSALGEGAVFADDLGGFRSFSCVHPSRPAAARGVTRSS